MPAQEKWVELDKYPGYLISNQGRVASIRDITPDAEKGYVQCAVTVDGERLKKYAHQLVAEAFLGKKPEDAEIHHKNGDKSDNRVANLEYVTREGNVRRTVEDGLHPHGDTHGRAKLSSEQVKEIRRRYEEEDATYQQLADEYGLHRVTVGEIIRRETWKHV